MKHSRSDYDRIQDPAGLIPEDEPVFFLRAQDTAAAATVRFWAMKAQDQGAKHDIIQNALRQANIMDDWAVKKIPDLPCDDKGV